MKESGQKDELISQHILGEPDLDLSNCTLHVTEAIAATAMPVVTPSSST